VWPIDLIGEDDVTEDGPLLKLKIAVSFLIPDTTRVPMISAGIRSGVN
jgi:hypothetical protein